ncbi:MAG: BON domain-containing protein [Actinomycetota bacterium]|nr:BON domain-containing protein [Actinomycetota bacterium]
MNKIRTIGVGALIAAAAVYFVRRAEWAGRAVGARLYAMWTPADDARLARKVESELARLDETPKEKISVNSAEGVVQLRGEADSQELIDTLAERARTVEGVRDVENLLHLPGAQAPMHQ